MSYYKKPDELLKRALINKHTEEKDRLCICSPTGYSLDCTAHEGEDDCPMVHEHKKRFPWGTAILIVLFSALLIYEVLYGGFNPLLYPGDSGC